ncbi:MAG TPA: potassium channel protein [Acidobacteriota bacterium]|nr:potassium channel protein [Acidobacteriota bacterium]
MNPFRRLLPAGTILLIVIGVGITGYIVIERWPLLDAIYMVVITLTTIGFQEVHSLSHAGRILTIVIAISGVGATLYAAVQTVEIIVEGEILGYRKRRKMDKRILEMQKHYVVCGYGRVGHQVAADLSATKTPYVVIDSKPETVSELEPKGVPYLIADATSDEILVEAGIRRAKGLVACSDSDVTNVYVTLSARALNPKLYIVARAGRQETENKLKMAGANRVISPYSISGRRMAAMVTRPVTSDFLDMVTHGGELEFRLHEIPVPDDSSLINRTLSEAEIRTKSGALVLAIHRADNSFNLQPRASSVISKGDTLVVIGTPEQIEALESLLI